MFGRFVQVFCSLLIFFFQIHHIHGTENIDTLLGYVQNDQQKIIEATTNASNLSFYNSQNWNLRRGITAFFVMNAMKHNNTKPYLPNFIKTITSGNGTIDSDLNNVHDHEGTFSAFGKEETLYHLLENIKESSSFFSKSLGEEKIENELTLNTILGPSNCQTNDVITANSVEKKTRLSNLTYLIGKVTQNQGSTVLSYIKELDSSFDSSAPTFFGLLNLVLDFLHTVPISFKTSSDSASTITLGTPEDVLKTPDDGTNSLCASLSSQNQNKEWTNLLYGIAHIGSRGYSNTLLTSLQEAISEFYEDKKYEDLVKTFLKSSACWDVLFGGNSQTADPGGSLWEKYLFLKEKKDIDDNNAYLNNDFENIFNLSDGVQNLSLSNLIKLYRCIVPETPVWRNGSQIKGEGKLLDRIGTLTLEECFFCLLSDSDDLADYKASLIEQIKIQLGNIETILKKAQIDFTPYQTHHKLVSQIAEFLDIGLTDFSKTTEFLRSILRQSFPSSEKSEHDFWREINETLDKIIKEGQIEESLDKISVLTHPDTETGEETDIESNYSNAIQTFCLEESLLLQSLPARISSLLTDQYFKDLPFFQDKKNLCGLIGKIEEKISDLATGYSQIKIEGSDSDQEIKKTFFAQQRLELLKIVDLLRTIRKKQEEKLFCTDIEYDEIQYEKTKKVLSCLNQSISWSYQMKNLSSLCCHKGLEKNTEDSNEDIDTLLTLFKESIPFPVEVSFPYTKDHFSDLKDILLQKASLAFQTVLFNIQKAHEVLAPFIADSLWKPLDFRGAPSVCLWKTVLPEFFKTVLQKEDNSVDLQALEKALIDLNNKWDSLQHFHQIEAIKQKADLFAWGIEVLSQNVDSVISQDSSTTSEDLLRLLQNWHDLIARFLTKPSTTKEFIQNIENAFKQKWTGVTIQLLEEVPRRIQKAVALYDLIIQKSTSFLSQFPSSSLQTSSDRLSVKYGIRTFQTFWTLSSVNIDDFIHQLNCSLDYEQGTHISLTIPSAPSISQQLQNTARYWEKVLLKAFNSSTCICSDQGASLEKLSKDLTKALIFSKQALDQKPAYLDIQKSAEYTAELKKLLSSLTSESDFSKELMEGLKKMPDFSSDLDIKGAFFSNHPLAPDCSQYPVLLSRIANQLTRIEKNLAQMPLNRALSADSSSFSEQDMESLLALVDDFKALSDISFQDFEAVHSLEESKLFHADIQQNLAKISIDLSNIYYFLSKDVEIGKTTLITECVLQWAHFLEQLAYKIQDKNLFEIPFSQKIIQTASVLISSLKDWEKFFQEPSSTTLQTDLKKNLQQLLTIWDLKIETSLRNMVEDPCSLIQHMQLTLIDSSKKVQQSLRTDYDQLQQASLVHVYPRLRASFSDIAQFLSVLSQDVKQAHLCPSYSADEKHKDFQQLLSRELVSLKKQSHLLSSFPANCLNINVKGEWDENWYESWKALYQDFYILQSLFDKSKLKIDLTQTCHFDEEFFTEKEIPSSIAEMVSRLKIVFTRKVLGLFPEEVVSASLLPFPSKEDPVSVFEKSVQAYDAFLEKAAEFFLSLAQLKEVSFSAPAKSLFKAWQKSLEDEKSVLIKKHNYPEEQKESCCPTVLPDNFKRASRLSQIIRGCLDQYDEAECSEEAQLTNQTHSLLRQTKAALIQWKVQNAEELFGSKIKKEKIQLIQVLNQVISWWSSPENLSKRNLLVHLNQSLEEILNQLSSFLIEEEEEKETVPAFRQTCAQEKQNLELILDVLAELEKEIISWPQTDGLQTKLNTAFQTWIAQLLNNEVLFSCPCSLCRDQDLVQTLERTKRKLTDLKSAFNKPFISGSCFALGQDILKLEEVLYKMSFQVRAVEKGLFLKGFQITECGKTFPEIPVSEEQETWEQYQSVFDKTSTFLDQILAFYPFAVVEPDKTLKPKYPFVLLKNQAERYKEVSLSDRESLAQARIIQNITQIAKSITTSAHLWMIPWEQRESPFRYSTPPPYDETIHKKMKRWATCLKSLALDNTLEEMPLAVRESFKHLAFAYEEVADGYERLKNREKEDEAYSLLEELKKVKIALQDCQALQDSKKLILLKIIVERHLNTLTSSTLVSPDSWKELLQKIESFLWSTSNPDSQRKPHRFSSVFESSQTYTEQAFEEFTSVLSELFSLTANLAPYEDSYPHRKNFLKELSDLADLIFQSIQEREYDIVRPDFLPIKARLNRVYQKNLYGQYQVFCGEDLLSHLMPLANQFITCLNSLSAITDHTSDTPMNESIAGTIEQMACEFNALAEKLAKIAEVPNRDHDATLFALYDELITSLKKELQEQLIPLQNNTQAFSLSQISASDLLFNLNHLHDRPHICIEIVLAKILNGFTKLSRYFDDLEIQTRLNNRMTQEYSARLPGAFIVLREGMGSIKSSLEQAAKQFQSCPQSDSYRKPAVLDLAKVLSTMSEKMDLISKNISERFWKRIACQFHLFLKKRQQHSEALFQISEALKTANEDTEHDCFENTPLINQLRTIETLVKNLTESLTNPAEGSQVSAYDFLSECAEGLAKNTNWYPYFKTIGTDAYYVDWSGEEQNLQIEEGVLCNLDQFCKDLESFSLEKYKEGLNSFYQNLAPLKENKIREHFEVERLFNSLADLCENFYATTFSNFLRFIQTAEGEKKTKDILNNLTLLESDAAEIAEKLKAIGKLYDASDCCKRLQEEIGTCAATVLDWANILYDLTQKQTDWTVLIKNLNTVFDDIPSLLADLSNAYASNKDIEDLTFWNCESKELKSSLEKLIKKIQDTSFLESEPSSKHYNFTSVPSSSEPHSFNKENTQLLQAFQFLSDSVHEILLRIQCEGVWSSNVYNISFRELQTLSTWIDLFKTNFMTMANLKGFPFGAFCVSCVLKKEAANKEEIEDGNEDAEETENEGSTEPTYSEVLQRIVLSLTQVQNLFGPINDLLRRERDHNEELALRKLCQNLLDFDLFLKNSDSNSNDFSAELLMNISSFLSELLDPVQSTLNTNLKETAPAQKFGGQDNPKIQALQSINTVFEKYPFFVYRKGFLPKVPYQKDSLIGYIEGVTDLTKGICLNFKKFCLRDQKALTDRKFIFAFSLLAQKVKQLSSLFERTTSPLITEVPYRSIIQQELLELADVFSVKAQSLLSQVSQETVELDSNFLDSTQRTAKTLYELSEWMRHLPAFFLRDLSFSEAAAGKEALSQSVQSFPSLQRIVQNSSNKDPILNILVQQAAQSLENFEKDLIQFVDQPVTQAPYPDHDEENVILHRALQQAQKILSSLQALWSCLERRPVVRFHKDIFDSLADLSKKLDAFAKDLGQITCQEKERSLILKEWSSIGFQVVEQLCHITNFLKSKEDSALSGFYYFKTVYLEKMAQALSLFPDSFFQEAEYLLAYAPLLSNLIQTLNVLKIQDQMHSLAMENARWNVLDSLRNLLIKLDIQAGTEQKKSFPFLNSPVDFRLDFKELCTFILKDIANDFWTQFCDKPRPTSLNVPLIGAYEHLDSLIEDLLYTEDLHRAFEYILDFLKNPECFVKETQVLQEIEQISRQMIQQSELFSKNSALLRIFEKAADQDSPFLLPAQTCTKDLLSCLNREQEGVLDKEQMLQEVKSELLTLKEALFDWKIQSDQSSKQILPAPSEKSCLQEEVFWHRMMLNLEKFSSSTIERLQDRILFALGESLPYFPSLNEQLQNLNKELLPLISFLQTKALAFCPDAMRLAYNQQQKGIVETLIKITHKISSLAEGVSDLIFSKLVQTLYGFQRNSLWLRNIVQDHLSSLENWDQEALNSVLQDYVRNWHVFLSEENFFEETQNYEALVRFLENIVGCQKELIQRLNIQNTAPPLFPAIVSSKKQLFLIIHDILHIQAEDEDRFKRILNQVENQIKAENFFPESFMVTLSHALHFQSYLLNEIIDPTFAEFNAIEKEILALFVPKDWSFNFLYRMKTAIVHQRDNQKYQQELETVIQHFDALHNLMNHIVTNFISSFAENDSEESNHIWSLASVVNVFAKLSPFLTDIMAYTNALYRRVEAYTSSPPCYYAIENDSSQVAFNQLVALNELLTSVVQSLGDHFVSSDSEDIEQDENWENFELFPENLPLNFEESIFETWTQINQQVANALTNIRQILFVLDRFDKTEDSPFTSLTSFALHGKVSTIAEKVQSLKEHSEKLCHLYELALYADLTTALGQIVLEIPALASIKILLFQNAIAKDSSDCLKKIAVETPDLLKVFEMLQAHPNNRTVLLQQLKSLHVCFKNMHISMNDYLETQEKEPIPFQTFERAQWDQHTFSVMQNILHSKLLNLSQQLNNWKTILEGQTGTNHDERCYDETAVESVQSIVKALTTLKDIDDQDLSWFCSMQHLLDLKSDFKTEADILSDVSELLKTTTCCTNRIEYLFKILPVIETFYAHMDPIFSQAPFPDLEEFKGENYEPLGTCLQTTAENLKQFGTRIEQINLPDKQYCNVPDYAETIDEVFSEINTLMAPIMDFLAILESPNSLLNPTSVAYSHNSCMDTQEVLRAIETQISSCFSLIKNFFEVAANITLTEDNYAFLTDLKEVQKSGDFFITRLSNFFTEQVPLICSYCQETEDLQHLLPYQNMIRDMTEIQEILSQTVQTLEESRYNNLSRSFHAFINTLEYEISLWKTFVSDQSDTFLKEPIFLFKNFLIDEIATYQKITTYLQQPFSESSPLGGDTVARFNDLCAFFESHQQNLVQILQQLNIPLKPTALALPPESFNKETLARDYQRLQDIFCEFANFLLRKSTTRPCHHSCVKNLWKNVQDIMQELFSTIAHFGFFPEDNLNQPLLALNKALQTFIFSLDQQVSHAMAFETSFFKDLVPNVKRINDFLECNLKSFQHNLTAQEYSDFTAALKNLSRILKEDLTSEMSSQLNVINQLNDLYVLTTAAPNFSDRSHLTTVEELLFALYQSAQDVVSCFDHEPIIPASQQETLLFEEPLHIDVVFHRLNQQTQIFTGLLTNIFAEVQKAPLRDFRESSISLCQDFLASFVRVAQSVPQLSLNCPFEDHSLSLILKETEGNTDEISKSIDPDQLHNFCCSRLVYTLFEKLNGFDLFLQVLDSLNCKNLILTFGGEQNQLASFVEKATALLVHDELGDLDSAFPRCKATSKNEHSESLVQTQVFWEKWCDFFEAAIRSFDHPALAPSCVIHPELYRCVTLPQAIEAWGNLIHKFDLIVQKQTETFKDEKLNPTIIRPLYLFFGKVKDLVQSLEDFISTFDDFQCSCRICQFTGIKAILSDQTEHCQSLIATLEKVQLTLDQYCFTAAAKQLNLYNKKLEYLSNIFLDLADNVNEYWEQLNVIPQEAFVSIYEDTEGIKDLYQEILELDMEGPCLLDHIALIFSKLSQHKGQTAQILTEYVHFMTKIEDPSESIPEEEELLSIDQAYQIFEATLENRKKLLKALENVSDELLMSGQNSSRNFSDLLRYFSAVCSDISNLLEKIYEKLQLGFFCEKFSVCPVCEDCDVCVNQENQETKCSFCKNSSEHPREIRHILWGIIKSYHSLSNLFLNIGEGIEEECCLSTFEILFPIQDLLLQAQASLSFALNQEKSPEVFIKASQVLLKYFLNVKNGLIAIQGLKSKTETEEHSCSMKVINGACEELLKETQVLEQNCRDLLNDYGLPLPSVADRNLEELDYYCYELPWFIKNITRTVEQLASDFNGTFYETEEQACLARILNEDFLKACQSLQTALFNTIVPDNQAMLCYKCDRIKFNQNIDLLAQAIGYLQIQFQRENNKALQNFCCSDFQHSLEKFAAVLQTLIQGLAAVSTKQIEQFLIQQPGLSALDQLADALNNTLSTQVALISRIHSLTQGNLCQTEILVSTLDELNQTLSSGVYEALGTFLKGFNLDLASIPDVSYSSQGDLFENILQSYQTLNDVIERLFLCTEENIEEIEGRRNLINSLEKFADYFEQSTLLFKEISLVPCAVCPLHDQLFYSVLEQVCQQKGQLTQTLTKISHTIPQNRNLREKLLWYRIEQAFRNIKIQVLKASEIPSLFEKLNQTWKENAPFSDRLSRIDEELNQIRQNLKALQTPNHFGLFDHLENIACSLEAMNLSISSFDPFPKEAYKDFSKERCLQDIRQHFPDLIEGLIWLANDIDFIHSPDLVSQQVVQKLKHLKQTCLSVKDELTSFTEETEEDPDFSSEGSASPDLSSSVQSLQNLKAILDGCQSLCDVPLEKMIEATQDILRFSEVLPNLYSLNVQIQTLANTLAATIPERNFDFSSVDPKSFQQAILTFFEKAPFLVDQAQLLSEAFDLCFIDESSDSSMTSPADFPLSRETILQILFKVSDLSFQDLIQSLAVVNQTFQPDSEVTVVDLSLQGKSFALSHIFSSLKQSLANLLYQLSCWKNTLIACWANIKDFSLQSDLAVSVDWEYTSLFLAKLQSLILKHLQIFSEGQDSQKTQETRSVLTFLADFLKGYSDLLQEWRNLFLTDRTENTMKNLNDLLVFAQKTSQNDQGLSVLTDIFQTRFNADGLPLLDEDGNVLTVPGTLLQKTKITSDFGIAMNNALFLSPYKSHVNY